MTKFMCHKLLEKEKIIKTSFFSFSHKVFLLFFLPLDKLFTEEEQKLSLYLGKKFMFTVVPF